MRYTILLDRNENTKQVEAQEQARFIKSMLEALEIPIEYDPDEPFSIEAKLKFRKSLDFYGINIVDDLGGGLKIYVNTDLIGEWKKCKYKLREDRSQIDPRKRLFFEMTVEFWTVYEDTNAQNIRT